MRHYDQQAWTQYVGESLSPDEMAQMEHHLYQCDICLAVYMMCLEQSAATLPLIEADEKSYVDSIVKRTLRTKPVWYRSTIFHYGIAAAATLILVATGFFHGLSQELGSVSSLSSKGFNPSVPSSIQKESPISDQLLDKTLTWLDTLQNEKDKGGIRP
ncbi:hypothetical protein [Paenibacillus sedimenti]|uniref:Zf-HC2 domain-containing protein n=1 Tax=Paenibacillus sedimenti TaxID=2770274 RepID=A0A926QMW7_9BACL|nr:hypothetical protein [Paenibacillus sedimenti]MBD0384358.1 hypothetical protein [Paenibacillus sedimenti]